ncbi:MAG: type II toxin-antitoxin system mRNA interferase toxin, RelE/StbE family [Patescibacteria group bacterium]|nr:type II toxin-antitoxin system mRNA interferase toxin, RelE/StbE family [Patescibacteria group bacterium]
MQIIVTKEFEKCYLVLPSVIKKKALKQEKLFRNNPFHPSLNTEKLSPKGKQLWSIRIDKTYRIVFRFIDGNTVLFLTTGTHDWIYKLKF